MKWLERTIWAMLVLVFASSTTVFWAAWKSTEEIWGRSQYMNHMHSIRIQQNLERNDIDAAMKFNRLHLSAYWKGYQAQDASNSLLMSQEQFDRLKTEMSTINPLE